MRAYFELLYSAHYALNIISLRVHKAEATIGTAPENGEKTVNVV